MKFVALCFLLWLPYSDALSQADIQKNLPELKFEDVVDHITMVPTSNGAASDGEIRIYLKSSFKGKVYEVTYSYYPPDQEVTNTVTIKGQPLTITNLFYNTYYITGLRSTDGNINIASKKCIPVFSAASALIPSGKTAQAFLDKAYDLIPKPEGKTAAVFEQGIRANVADRLRLTTNDSTAGKESAAFTSSLGGGNTSSFTSCQVVVPSGANAGNVVTLQSGYWYKTSNLQTPMNGTGAGTFSYLDPATCTFSTSVQAVCGYSSSADGGVIYNPNYYWSILNPTPANTASLTTNGAGLSWAQIRQAAYVYGKYGYNANTEDVVHHLFYNLTSQYSNPLNSTTQAIYNDAITNYKIITVNPSITASNVTGAGTVGNPVSINITSNADIIMLPTGTVFTVCGGTATISGDTLKVGGTEGAVRTTSVCAFSSSPATKVLDFCITGVNHADVWLMMPQGPLAYQHFFSLKVNPFNTCQSATASWSCSVNPVITASATTLCQGQTATLTASGGSSYNWSNGPATPSITVSQAGTYTATVHGTGCNGTVSKTIVVNPLPSVTITAPNTICSGSSTTLTASGTGSSYTWVANSGSGNVSIGSGSSITVTPAANTTYTVTAMDVNGCSATAQKTITIGAASSISISGPATVCSGSQLTLTAVGGSSPYTWSYNIGNSSYNLTSSSSTFSTYPTSTITYTLTSSSNGCLGSATKTVTILNAPSITINGANGKCSGSSQSLTLSVSGGSAPYTWSTGGTGSSIIVNPSATQTYTVTSAASANGCPGAAQKTVEVYPLPAISISGPTTICSGSSATLNASGAATYAWSWSGGTATGSTVNVTPSVSTTYLATGTDLNGCKNTASQIINIGSSLAVSISGASSISCGGQPVTLTASVAGATYYWSPGGYTTQSITVNPQATTQYTVSVTSGTCTGQASKMITVTPAIHLTIDGPDVLCLGSETTLTAQGAGPNYVWAWAVTTANSTSSTTMTGYYPSIIVAPTVTTTFKLFLGPFGCSDTATKTITVLPSPVASITGPSSICSGSLLTLNGSSNTSSSFSWNTGATGNTLSVYPVNTTLAAINTLYVLTATAANGCIDTVQKNVTIMAVPTVYITGPSSICTGTSINLEASGTSPSPVNGSGGVNYTWYTSTGGGANVYTGTGTNMSFSPVTTTTYTVIAQTADGCRDTAVHVVTVYNSSTASISGPASVCSGGSITLVAGGGGTYLWSYNNAVTASITVSPATTTTYIVTVNNNGCIDTAQRTVTVVATPVVSISGTATICSGTPVTLTASSSVTGGSWLWESSTDGGTTYSVITGQTSTTLTTTPLANIIYRATYTAAGCSGQRIYPVTVITAVSTPGNMGSDQSNCGGYDPSPITELTAPLGGSNYEYEWESSPSGAAGTWTIINGATGSSYDPPAITQTTYYRRRINSNGCTTYVYSTAVIKAITAAPNAGISGAIPICPSSSGTINLASIITGEQSGGNWTRTSGTGGTFNAAAGTFIPVGATTSIFTYTVTGTAPCANSTATATINISAVALINSATPVCNSGLTTYNITVSTSNATSVTSGAYTVTGGPDTWIIQNIPVGINVTITATNVAGCSSSQSVTAPVCVCSAGAPVASNVFRCGNGTVTLTATAGANTNEVRWYALVAGGTALATGTTYTTPVLSPGIVTYYVAGYNTASNCESARTPVVVTINSAPLLNLNVTGLCPRTPVTITATVQSGTGTSPYTYRFDTAGVVIQNGSSTSLTFIPQGSVNLTVTVTDGKGCTDIKSIPVNASPTLTLTNIINICKGQSTTVTADNGGFTGYIYRWLDDNSSNPVRNVTPTVTTNYTVERTTPQGCKDTATSTVIVYTAPVIAATVKTDASCAGNDGTITVTATGSTTLEYSLNGTSWQSSNVFSGLGAGTYNVLVRNTNLICTNTVSSPVRVSTRGRLGFNVPALFFIYCANIELK
jgi:hypothetical protein